MSHSQKRHRFGVRVVHSEGPHPALRPPKNQIFQLLPQRFPLRVVVIQWIHILVFFWRILRVFDRSIRPVEKPFGVIGHIRMIRGAIQREIQRDLESALLRLADQPLEILQRSQLGRDIAMTTAVRTPLMPVADSVRHPRIVRTALERVVRTLALGHPDRMDRREINHVEAHRLGIVQPPEAIPEGRTAVAASLRRPREKLIPRGEQRPLALGGHATEWTELRGQTPVRIRRHQHCHVLRAASAAAAARPDAFNSPAAARNSRAPDFRPAR